MMTELSTGQETFQSFLNDLNNQVNQQGMLQKLQAKAWDHCQQLGLPSRKDEVFRYVPLRKFYLQFYTPSHPVDIDEKQLEQHILPECQQSVLIFVNGHFSIKHSRIQSLSKKISISTIAEAMTTYSGFLNTQWTKSIKEETDPFAAINTALHRDGLFLYLPPKTIVDTPIQLLNIIDTQSSQMFIMPRLQVFAGAQSELSLFSTQAVFSGQYGMNITAEINVEEEAHVNYFQMACDKEDDHWHFDALRASLKRNSTLKTIAITDGASTVRHDYRVVLIGENAEASLNGVLMLNGNNEAHNHILIDHQAPNCRSMQLFKGALNEASKSSFEGKILVRQAAQKTEAFQLNNNLLLSNYAHADSKPNLEIFADDVKASHGSTFGQLDKEQIFYMKSRGFSEADAKNLLVYSFCQEVIDMVTLDSLQKTLRKRAHNYLKG